MSKAFVKEDEEEPDELPELGGGEKGCITAQGYQRLASEFDQLWRVERPKVTNEVYWAAAQGDRSENAEYIYGKRRLREIDRRLRFLKRRLENLTVVTPSPEQAGRAFFGAWVTLVDDEEQEVTYRLVGTDEIDLARRWISLDSPIGKALLGKAPGDLVVVHRPKGPAEFTIASIRYEARDQAENH